MLARIISAIVKMPQRFQDPGYCVFNHCHGATLRKKTGFEGRKIRDIVYRLKKPGKIKVEGKGVYLKA